MSMGIPWGLAKRRADAVNHLTEMMGQLGEVYGVAPIEFTHPSSRVDPWITQMQELELMDQWLTALMPLLVPNETVPETVVVDAEVDAESARSDKQVKRK